MPLWTKTEKVLMVKESEVRALLRGIDYATVHGEDGWWETFTGADFGEERLEALLALLDERGVLLRGE